MVMNFDVDYRYIHTVRSPQAVPLLVLLKEWASYGQDAFAQTDLILLILQGIQPLAKFQHGLVSSVCFLDDPVPTVVSSFNIQEVQEILCRLDGSELRSKFFNRYFFLVHKFYL